MRLGIMGGTFDPIHYGHLFIAEEARVLHQLERVLFLPSGQPPHKRDREITEAHHRLEMARIGIRSNPNFACSSIETERPGYSYTVDTLETIQNRFPNAELYYITGTDAIADLMTWKHPEKVIRMAIFLAATRPGFDIEILKKRLPEETLSRIQLMETHAPDISSSEIRERLKANAPVRYLLPDEVLEYIQSARLYRVATEAELAPNQKGTEIERK